MDIKNWKKGPLYLLTGLIIGAGLGVLILFGFGESGNILGFIKSHLNLFTLEGPVVGKPAPDFELTDLKGKTIRLSSLRGRPVLINFWATWCVPCAQEMPMIESEYEKQKAQFEVLAVNADEPFQNVREYVSRMGLTFWVLLDPGGNVLSLYHLQGYPSSFFVDANGIIQAEHVGSMDANQFNQYLLQVGVGQ